MPQRHVSTTHSMSTLTVSRDRQKPASSIVNPTCMPNTRNAATSVHTVLIGLMMSEALTSGAGAAAPAAGAAGVAVPVVPSPALASGALASGVLASAVFVSVVFASASAA